MAASGRDRRATLPRRRRWPFAAGAVVLAAAIAVPVVRGSGSGAGGPEAVAPRPVAYEVLYSVHVATGASPTTTYELLDVRRPFDVSDLTFAVPPGPGVAPRSGTVTTRSELYDVGDGGALRAVGGRQPGPGTGDQSLLAERADLLARHLAVRVGHQRVAGRGCDLYRLLEPPAGPIAPLDASGDHDIVCIDAEGLVLGEQWTYHGRVVEARQALRVRTDPRDVHVLDTAGAAPAPPQTSTATPLSLADVERYAPAVTTPPVPAGYAPAGVDEVVLPDPQQPSKVLDTSVVWTFTRGPDSISVEAGVGQLPWAGAGTGGVEPVRLAGLGPAVTAVDSDGADVRVDLGQAHWVRVRGTTDVATLVAYADTLAPA